MIERVTTWFRRLKAQIMLQTEPGEGENVHMPVRDSWRAFFVGLGFVGFAGMLLLCLPVGVLVLYFIANSPFLWFYERTHMYRWWPVLYLVLTATAIGVMLYAVHRRRDPIRAGTSPFLLAFSLATVVTLSFMTLFFARSWSFMAFPVRWLCLLLVAVSTLLALWLAATNIYLWPVIREPINHLVVRLMEAVLGGKKYAEAAKDLVKQVDRFDATKKIKDLGEEIKVLYVRVTTPVSPDAPKWQFVVLTLCGRLIRLVVLIFREIFELAVMLSKPFLIPVAEMVRKRVERARPTETTDAGEEKRENVLRDPSPRRMPWWMRPLVWPARLLLRILDRFFKLPFDHYLHVLQCRALNALVRAEEEWSKYKWKVATGLVDNTSKKDPTKRLKDNLGDLRKLQDQYIRYALFYEGFRPTIRNHLFVWPWMPGVVQARFALEQKIRRERSRILDGKLSSRGPDEEPDEVNLSNLVSERGPQPIRKLIADLQEWAEKHPPENDSQLWEFVQMGSGFLDRKIPWGYVSKLRVDIGNRSNETPDWLDRFDVDLYKYEIGPLPGSRLLWSEAPDVASFVAVRLLARCAFCMWIVRLAQKGPEFAAKCAHEKLEKLRSNEASSWMASFLCGPEGNHLIGDLLILHASGQGSLRQNKRQPLRGMLADADDAYAAAGAPEDRKELHGFISMYGQWNEPSEGSQE